MITKTDRKAERQRRHKRVRTKISGTTECPRLAVCRTNKNIIAQIIDDTKGGTLVAASTVEKEVSDGLKKTNDTDAAKKLGGVIAKRALDKGIKTVVFDRGGFIYAGKVAALADAAREAGLDF